jgi:predicted  nucleic acid-binding Zn-ribbon protein
MPRPDGYDTLCLVSSAFWKLAVMDEVARCPHCGAIKGGTAAAIDALYCEVSRINDLAERQRPTPQDVTEAIEVTRELDAAKAREAELLREIRLLRETVARLRGGSRVTST